MLPPHVRVHDLKPCLGAGAIRWGVAAFLYVCERTYLAVAGHDVPVEFDARIVFICPLLESARVAVAHLPMPHVCVYLRASDFG